MKAIIGVLLFVLSAGCYSSEHITNLGWSDVERSTPVLFNRSQELTTDLIFRTKIFRSTEIKQQKSEYQPNDKALQQIDKFQTIKVEGSFSGNVTASIRDILTYTIISTQVIKINEGALEFNVGDAIYGLPATEQTLYLLVEITSNDGEKGSISFNLSEAKIRPYLEKRNEREEQAKNIKIALELFNEQLKQALKTKNYQQVLNSLENIRLYTPDLHANFGFHYGYTCFLLKKNTLAKHYLSTYLQQTGDMGKYRFQAHQVLKKIN
ncbi:hypothetical protein [Marinomonas sp. PE14-40]|uniref:hypothetical protein n=1 Tax=Marinomonas sp. PE14-40 TaxID=3060621 RepID=UPI003F66D50A